MDDLKSLLLKKRVKVGVVDKNTERGEMLRKFCERLNKDREGTKYAALKIPRIAKLFEGRPIGYMYKMWRECEEATIFARFFWWKIKLDKDKI